MTSPGRGYFEPANAARQVLLWAVATRVQLDRWELHAARFIQEVNSGVREPDGPNVWAALREHHFCLVAATHLIEAGDLLTPALSIRSDVRADIIAGRDLLEHWIENMPAFNRRPHKALPQRRGTQGFAQRNPNATPYLMALDWHSQHGAMLTPTVPGIVVHDLVDQAERRAVAINPLLAAYIPARQVSNDKDSTCDG